MGLKNKFALDEAHDMIFFFAGLSLGFLLSYFLVVGSYILLGLLSVGVLLFSSFFRTIGVSISAGILIAAFGCIYLGYGIGFFWYNVAFSSFVFLYMFLIDHRYFYHFA